MSDILSSGVCVMVWLSWLFLYCVLCAVLVDNSCPELADLQDHQLCTARHKALAPVPYCGEGLC